MCLARHSCDTKECSILLGCLLIPYRQKYVRVAYPSLMCIRCDQNSYLNLENEFMSISHMTCVSIRGRLSGSGGLSNGTKLYRFLSCFGGKLLHGLGVPLHQVVMCWRSVGYWTVLVRSISLLVSHVSSLCHPLRCILLKTT